jgi:hypothetical protein
MGGIRNFLGWFFNEFFPSGHQFLKLLNLQKKAALVFRCCPINWCSGNTTCVLRRCLVQISAKSLTMLTKVFMLFSSLLKQMLVQYFNQATFGSLWSCLDCLLTTWYCTFQVTNMKQTTEVCLKWSVCGLCTSSCSCYYISECFCFQVKENTKSSGPLRVSYCHSQPLDDGQSPQK